MRQELWFKSLVTGVRSWVSEAGGRRRGRRSGWDSGPAAGAATVDAPANVPPNVEGKKETVPGLTCTFTQPSLYESSIKSTTLIRCQVLRADEQLTTNRISGQDERRLLGRDIN